MKEFSVWNEELRRRLAVWRLDKFLIAATFGYLTDR
jgi:hypothetical protein